jgi:hypothetical protein
LRKIPIFALSLTFLLTAASQAANGQADDMKLIDSLSAIVSFESKDTSNIRNLCRLSAACFVIKYDKGIEIGNTALNLARSIRHKSLEAAALESIGKNYWGKNQFSEALRYHTEALQIFTSTNDYNGMVKAQMSIASNAFAQNQLKTALHYYSLALEITRNKIKDPELIAGNNGVLQCMAMTYHAMGNKEKAIAVLNEAEKVLIKHNLLKHRIGVHYLYGDVLAFHNQIEAAEDELNKGLKIALGIKDPYWCGKIEDQLAYIEKNRSNYVKSIWHSKTALNHFTEGRIEGHMAKSHSDIAATVLDAIKNNYLLEIENPLQYAINNLEEALILARPISHYTRLMEYEKYLADAYALQGNFKKSLEAYKNFRNYQDSVYNVDREKDFVRQILELEFNKKTDSIKSINRLDSIKLKNLEQKAALKNASIQKMWMYFVGFFLFAIGIGWYLYREKKNRIRTLQLMIENEKIQQQTQERELQKKINDLSHAALQSQLNPHFIFNCLNSIKLYIEENQKENASHYLSRFALLMRKALDATSNETISLFDEIELASLYLEMESMRLKTKLSWNIHCAAHVDAELIQIPPMLLQPFVENAIWHGLMPTEGGGIIKIEIDYNKENDEVVITIIDNGKGLRNSKDNYTTRQIKHVSRGIQMIEERLQMFAKKYQKVCTLNVLDIDNGDQTGTSVIITIKSI